MSYDIKPSDKGDVKPVDSMESIEQSLHEYYSGREIKLPESDVFDPQLEVQPPFIVEREILPGVINGQTRDKSIVYASVITQDGRTIRAKIISVMEDQIIKEFEPCFIVRGKDDNEWFCFTQKYETKELRLYEIVNIPVLDGADETRNWWCEGKRLYYNSDNQKWDMDDLVETLEFPMWYCPDVGPGLVHARVWVWCIGDSRYIVAIPEGIWRFELKEDLDDSDDSAEAYLVKPDGTKDETATFTVFDILENKSGKIGDRGYCKYMTDSKEFEILGFENGGLIKWAIWQSGSNNTGATSQAFQVQDCKYDGSSPTGSAFEVKTPIKKNHHTSLFTGYVVGYQIEADGTKVIVTDCWDDPFGVVKQWDVAIANVPNGWSELTGARGKYIVGVDNDHALDATGGNLTHTHEAHVHASAEVAGSGWVTCVKMANHTHDPMNHEPPYLGLYNIKRTS